MAILITDAIKSAKNEIKFIIPSDLKFVFNILSSPAIIHAGKRGQGCECPLSPIATGLESCFLSLIIAPTS